MIAAINLGEESPSSVGQGAGEIPVEATLRKVQQKYTAKSRIRFANSDISPNFLGNLDQSWI